MPYTPHNVYVYLAAFTGCLTGIESVGRMPVSNTPSDYATPVSIAEAYAQEFDTVFFNAGGSADSLTVQAIESISLGLFAQRFSGSVDPTFYNTICSRISALVMEAVALVTASIGPIPPYGGGSQGAQGNQGNQGYQGAFGGPQGDQGNQGDRGYQGDIGSGTQGNQGDQGYQGDTGLGTQGNQGDQGYQGDTGLGTQGNQGDQGYQGDIGSGTQGNQGYQGSSGSTDSIPTYTAGLCVLSNVANLANFDVTNVDSVSPAGQGEIVLLLSQTNGPENGPYEVGVVTLGYAPLTRPSWWAASSTQKVGTRLLVKKGTIYKGVTFKSIYYSVNQITVDSNNPYFYPDVFTYETTLSGGVGYSSNIAVPTTTVGVAIVRTAASNCSNTVQYEGAVYSPGYPGVGDYRVYARQADGTLNSSDTSTVRVTLFTQEGI